MSGEELGDDSPGAVLKRAREAQGAQLRDVAEALHLPIHVVDALERGDKTRLPAHVFTRGYVRAYAKLLELDPEALVTTLTYSEGVGTQKRLPAERPGLPFTRQQQMIGAGALGGLVLIVLLVAIFSGGEEASPAGEVGAEQDAHEPPGSVVQAPVVSPQQPVVATTEAPADADVASTTADDTTADDTTAASAPAVVQTEPVNAIFEADAPAATPAVAPSNARRLTATGGDLLALEFTDDCWVEIKDGSGTTLFADLGSAGRRLEFVGGGPFRILLGYAPGARMEFNSEPVALTPHTRNNVATLVIGQ